MSGDLALRVSVHDPLGHFLSFAQVMAQSRIIDELQIQRGQIQYQIAIQQAQLAEFQKSNAIAEQIVAIEQKRLELDILKEQRDENERAEREAEMKRVKHLRNVLAEATLELESLKADLDGRTAP
jgi:hypothetical protein